MINRQLKGTDLSVSRACFGTMTFDPQIGEQIAHEMVDTRLEKGIIFFDTANAYQSGASEEILGEAISGGRDKIILASKVRGKMGDGSN